MGPVAHALLIDEEATLFRNAGPRPNAASALGALRALKDTDGEHVVILLLTHGCSGSTPGEVRASENEVRARLGRADLARYFRPVTKRVTVLAGGPRQHAYERVLKRAGVAVENAIVCTRDDARAEECRRRGVHVLQFGVDCTDWSEVPLLVWRALDPSSPADAKAALTPWLEAQQGLHLVRVESPLSTTSVRVRVRPTGVGARHAATVARVTLDEAGLVAAIDYDGEPPQVEIEAAALRRSLEAHGQLAELGESTDRDGVTHKVTVDDSGRETVERTRFSAF